MCGNHRSDGTPIDHHHPPHAPPRPMRRRAFLGEVGKGTVAIAVFSPAILAACSGDDTTSPELPTTTTTTPPATASDDDSPTDTTPSESTAPLRWARATLGSVSAYVLARGTEATIVDTGNPGSAGDIGETLATLGLGYADVRHVVLTHFHRDHIGSTTEVLEMAEGAVAHAGELDLDDIAAGSVDIDAIRPLAGGEEIFGLEMLATPGHTEGHIAVIDHDAGLLVAGDALTADANGVAGPNPRFTPDLETAHESVRRLAELTFNTVLVGHGDPVENDADTQVAALAASLA
jgi:glyoxylase-like metal-dependent hydrolase (beta-lactamase superfamily II)